MWRYLRGFSYVYDLTFFLMLSSFPDKTIKINSPFPSSPVQSHCDGGSGLNLLTCGDGCFGQGCDCLRGLRGLSGLDCHLAALEGGPVLLHLKGNNALSYEKRTWISSLKITVTGLFSFCGAERTAPIKCTSHNLLHIVSGSEPLVALLLNSSEDLLDLSLF